ncbi:unnamed protein product [Cutaneotrichosporon oleaginosum]
MAPLSIKGHPAPVLPAMGLHSFHNDSPPFAGASMMEHSEPTSLSLGDSVHSSLSRSSDPRTSPDATLRALQSEAVPQGSAGDEEAGRARSRRLVSGYRFGNPPSPLVVNNGLAQSATYGAYTEGEEVTLDVERETLESDSPPLTEPDESALDPEPHLHPDLEVEGKQTAMRRRSERQSNRGAVWGMDTLVGLNDGEADADDRAPKSEHPTQAYLRGEGGEAGMYRFPRHRLKSRMKDETKIPLVIVACGSFSPPTYLHLRMFEMAKDEIVESGTYEIMAGYYSPVSSYYKKAGLAPAIHRVRMCELAVEHTSTWLMVDPWEAGQPEYQRTAVVLEHFEEMLNGNGGVHMADGSRRRYKIMLLAGGDLIESFGEPGVWSEPDLHIILGRFGCLIVERAGSDVWAFLLSHDILYHHRRNVIVIKQLIYNDISSTKVRLFVRRGMSIKYLLPNSVIQYIHEHKLYREPDRKLIGG